MSWLHPPHWGTLFSWYVYQGFSGLFVITFSLPVNDRTWQGILTTALYGKYHETQILQTTENLFLIPTIVTKHFENTNNKRKTLITSVLSKLEFRNLAIL